MAHINKCIKDLLEKSGKKASSEHAAVWVPDSEAVVCMVCTKSQFNVLNRRVSNKGSFINYVNATKVRGLALTSRQGIMAST